MVNRQILFRGKRVDNGEWIDGCHYKKDNNPCFMGEIEEQHFIMFQNNLDWNLVEMRQEEVIPKTVGQFTGRVLDGVKVYEGDILEDRKKKKYTVIWDPDCCHYDLKPHVPEELYSRPYFDQISTRGLKVAGNIFDNPGLVESEE